VDTSRMAALGPSPFIMPPMPKKVMFADSPQSETQQMSAVTFKHSLGPSPSWDYTPHSQSSWRDSQGVPSFGEKPNSHGLASGSAASTAPYGITPATQPPEATLKVA
jgi:hypothetical protein